MLSSCHENSYIFNCYYLSSFSTLFITQVSVVTIEEWRPYAFIIKQKVFFLGCGPYRWLTSPNRETKKKKIKSPLAAIVNPPAKKKKKTFKKQKKNGIFLSNGRILSVFSKHSWEGFKHLNCQFNTGGTVRHLVELYKEIEEEMKNSKKNRLKLILVSDTAKWPRVFFLFLQTARKRSGPRPDI